ncbi:MAG: HD domain-containing protein [Leptodesmis sp.]|uniref:HD domain-containing protein n=1 Tax=Leptodesmis sp. TaxID=3100501 RepID=UPI003D0EBD19
MTTAPIGAKLAQAIHLATAYHQGQVDKAGQPYIQHPLRVMHAVAGETEKIVAVLHDTLEDTAITLEEITSNFGTEVAEAIVALTKNKDEDYFDFIRRVKRNAIATKVKIADLQGNLDLSRLSVVTEKDQARVSKYQQALVMLLEDGASLGDQPTF